LELIKDYDLEVHYHPGKANVVADALSRKAHYNYLPAIILTWEDSSIRVPPGMAQSSDEGVAHIKRRLTEGDPKVNCICMDHEGALWFKDRLVLLKNHELHKKIFDEAHTSKYSIHPGSTKMYYGLEVQFWWTRMKHETTWYVAECDMYRRVKDDHMRPTDCYNL
jgi:hypothetical protein